MYQATSSGPQNVALLNGNRQLATGMQPWGNLGTGMQPWGQLGAAQNDLASQMAAGGVRQYKGGVWSSYQCAGCAGALADMQAQLTRAGTALGIRGGITADGVIGDGTLAYAKAVGAAAMKRYEYVAEGAGITGAAATKERLARNAIAVAGFARSIANRLNAPPAVATPVPGPTLPTGPTAPTPVPTAPPLPGPGDLPGMTATASPFMVFLKAKWPWLVGGAILVGGGITAVHILSTPIPRTRVARAR